MSLQQYSDLVTAASRWINRPALSVYVPDFITLAHIRMCREIRVDWVSRRLAKLGSDAIAGNGAEFTLPSDFNGIRYIKINRNPILNLRYITPEAADFQNLANQSGDPKFYTIDSGILTILPYAKVDDNITISQYFKPVAIDDSINTTNEFTSNAFDAYLFATILEASLFVKDDERLQMWETRYEGVINSIIEDDKQRRWGETSMESSAPYVDILQRDVASG